MSKEHVVILQAAMCEVKSGRHQYICIAINHAAYCTGYGTAARQIKEQIMEDLEDCSSLESWLCSWQRAWPVSVYEHADEVRRTRLAWIDALIVYWKDKP